jgi:hypothetical protein
LIVEIFEYFSNFSGSALDILVEFTASLDSRDCSVGQGK